MNGYTGQSVRQVAFCATEHGILCHIRPGQVTSATEHSDKCAGLRVHAFRQCDTVRSARRNDACVTPTHGVLTAARRVDELAWSGGAACRIARRDRRDPQAGPIRYVARTRAVELVEHPLERTVDNLHPLQPRRVERAVARTAHRTSRDEQNRVEAVADRAPALRVLPGARPRELAVLRPRPERKREGADTVSGYGGVVRHHAASDLFLDVRVRVLRQVRMPQRVVAELEALVSEEAHLLHAPFA